MIEIAGAVQDILSDELALKPEELNPTEETFLTYNTHHKLAVSGLQINGHGCRPEFDGKLEISADEDNGGALGGTFICEYESDMFEEDYKIDVEFWGRRAKVQPTPRTETESKRPRYTIAGASAAQSAWVTSLSPEMLEQLRKGREQHEAQQALLNSMY